MRTYSVVRNIFTREGGQFNRDELVRTGLSWLDAKTLEGHLQGKEKREHPERDSWTCDLYSVQMEAEQKELVFDLAREMDEFAKGLAAYEAAYKKEHNQ